MTRGETIDNFALTHPRHHSWVIFLNGTRTRSKPFQRKLASLCQYWLSFFWDALRKINIDLPTWNPSRKPGAVRRERHILLQSFSEFYRITRSVSRRGFNFFILFPFVTFKRKPRDVIIQRRCEFLESREIKTRKIQEIYGERRWMDVA